MKPLWVRALLLTAAGCGGDYGNAAIATAGGVAHAGVNRAVTKECWAQCRPGLLCDHETGMCVEHKPCKGRCASNERCETEGQVEERCVPILDLSVVIRDAGAD